MSQRIKKDETSNPRESIRINLTLRGEPAKWLKEWKRRGLVKSNSDAVVQSFILYNEKQQKIDLERARLDRLRA